MITHYNANKITITYWGWSEKHLIDLDIIDIALPRLFRLRNTTEAEAGGGGRQCVFVCVCAEMSTLLSIGCHIDPENQYSHTHSANRAKLDKFNLNFVSAK